MRILRYFSVAFESILAHKLRASLTMLGIIIGVAAVLTTVGIGRGANASITDELSSQGTTLITVSPGAASSGGFSGGSVSTLTLGDVAALEESSLHPHIANLAPVYSSSAQLVYGTTNTQNQVTGTTADFESVRKQTVATGRFLSQADTVDQNRVVVLGGTAATDLFLNEDPVGKTVRINNEPFEVIGVLETSGSSGFGSTDTQAFVPISVAQGRLFNADRYRGEYVVSSISVEAVDEAGVTPAQAEIEETLRLRHGLAVDDDNDFTVTNQSSLLDAVNTITGVLTIFLGSIGGISLLVGGIGIMNIMLVSVTERTREIGLRKAIGAQDSDILLQFLIEALVLTALGGLIGIGFSYGIAGIVGQIPNFDFQVLIQPDIILMALAVSTASGFVFGLYPAMRATRLDPIEALRYE